jgi:hypothetical protein
MENPILGIVPFSIVSVTRKFISRFCSTTHQKRVPEGETRGLAFLISCNGRAVALVASPRHMVQTFNCSVSGDTKRRNLMITSRLISDGLFIGNNYASSAHRASLKTN